MNPSTNPRRRAPAALAAAFLIIAALAGAAPSARAGSYAVVSCSDLGPGRVVRPVDGWYLEKGVYPSRDECGAGGGLYATGGRGADLYRFDAPLGTTIARLVVAYRAHLPGAEAWAVPTLVVEAGHRGGWEYIAPARGHIGGAPIDFGSDRAVGDARGADALRIGTRCELAGPCTKGGQPEARFYALAVVLADDRAPRATLSAPTGHLHDKVDLAVGASDEGGGVFGRTVSVDGRVLASGALCPTVRATVGAVRHVTRRVPCPLDAPAHVRFDTPAVADGAHLVLARVEDVAGNARTAAARVVVDNLPPRAGSVALSGEASDALTATASGFAGQDVTYAYRWERCDGSGCREVGGAIRRTYAPRPADAGRRLRAVVSASDEGGTTRVASAPSGLVPGPSGAASAPDPVDTAPRGRLTAWLERGRRRLRRTTVTWPTRVRIRGRLTDVAGRPLARTPVRMFERFDGRRWQATTGLETRHDGRLTTFTRIGPSRRVRLQYGGALVTLRVRVRARVRLRVRRQGSRTLVRGRVLGGAVPRAGLRLLLQSRARLRWATRAALRTDGLGRFSAIGRTPAGVRLRVVVPAQRGYPFARGVSR